MYRSKYLSCDDGIPIKMKLKDWSLKASEKIWDTARHSARRAPFLRLKTIFGFFLLCEHMEISDVPDVRIPTSSFWFENIESGPSFWWVYHFHTTLRLKSALFWKSRFFSILGHFGEFKFWVARAKNGNFGASRGRAECGMGTRCNTTKVYAC